MLSQHTSAETPLTDILLEAAGVGLCLVAPGGTIVRANSEWLRSTGLELEAVVGANRIGFFEILSRARMSPSTTPATIASTVSWIVIQAPDMSCGNMASRNPKSMGNVNTPTVYREHE